ncbi:unnamed protein product [Closterium sp. NIES-65]|nr:unnamed protein product [Closterium sp. NIES-65]CAI6008793.1 unnamed protein product [Closterium sp. NIES-65]
MSLICIPLTPHPSSSIPLSPLLPHFLLKSPNLATLLLTFTPNAGGRSSGLFLSRSNPRAEHALFLQPPPPPPTLPGHHITTPYSPPPSALAAAAADCSCATATHERSIPLFLQPPPPPTLPGHQITTPYSPPPSALAAAAAAAVDCSCSAAATRGQSPKRPS